MTAGDSLNRNGRIDFTGTNTGNERVIAYTDRGGTAWNIDANGDFDTIGNIEFANIRPTAGQNRFTLGLTSTPTETYTITFPATAADEGTAGNVFGLTTSPADDDDVDCALAWTELANNTLPLGGLRNEVGKVINPYMKELNREIDDQVRNRNQTTELLAGEPLPIKYDILNGKKINDWDLPTRLFNMFSPVKINPNWSPGRALLFESKYDLALIATKPNGIDLSKHPKLRSEYQRLMGEQNVEAKLNNLANDPKIQQSLDDMRNDRRDPNMEGTEPALYEVNQRIQVIMEDASSKALRMLMRNPEMKRLLQEKQLLDAADRSLKTGQRRAYEIRRQQLNDLRNMPK